MRKKVKICPYPCVATDTGKNLPPQPQAESDPSGPGDSESEYKTEIGFELRQETAVEFQLTAPIAEE